MKDTRGTVTLGGVEYPIVFNINVMEEIQEKYGSLTEWGQVTEANADGIDLKAVKFGLCAMINEGLDMENEETGGDRPFITSKWLGRQLMAAGLEDIAGVMNELVMESTQDDGAPKNA